MGSLFDFSAAVSNTENVGEYREYKLSSVCFQLVFIVLYVAIIRWHFWDFWSIARIYQQEHWSDRIRSVRERVNLWNLLNIDAMKISESEEVYEF
jgi:hypothetical protein